MWLERLAPHAPIDQCRPRGRLHNRTGEACPERSRGNNADVHLKRQVMGREVVVAVTNADVHLKRQVMGCEVVVAVTNADVHLKRQVTGREVVVAVTNGRLDGFV
jgi:thiamine phosphate synthase YjbQ (UPF0047 family)